MSTRINDLADASGTIVNPSAARDASAALGAALRAARERRGLSLQHVADRTRIPRRHLESLEQGNLEAIPAGPYRRGEVIAFSQAVGLDRDEALRYFERAVPPAVRMRDRHSPTGAGLPVSMFDRMPRRWVVTALTMVVVGAVLVWPRRSTPPAPPPDAPVALTEARANPPVPVATTGEAATADRSSRERSTSASISINEPEHAGAGADAGAAAAAGDVAPTATTDRRLVILTVPAGARVTVDGVGWGATPVSIPYLPPGPKRVRVTREGFAPAEQWVTLAAEGTTTVRLTLQ